MIDKYQHKDKELLSKLKRANYHTKYFRGVEIFTKLICRSDKIVIQIILQKYVVNWYKTYLLKTGMNFNAATISQH